MSRIMLFKDFKELSMRPRFCCYTKLDFLSIFQPTNRILRIIPPWCDPYKGVFNNYVDRISPFFDPLPPPLRGHFLYPEHGQKQTFFDSLSPHLFHVVIEWPLSETWQNHLWSCLQHALLVILSNANEVNKILPGNTK